MRIGVDARELQGRPTGTGRYLRSLLRAWTADGRDRIYAYFNGPAPDDPVLSHAAVAVRALGQTPSRGIVWQERSLPRAVGPDVLDVFFSPAYICPLSLRLPRVTAIHDLSFFARPEDFPWLDGARRRALVSASARASTRILACSPFTRREIAAWLPAAAGRTLHVPLGADDDLAPPLPPEAARAALAVRGPYVITVGAILNRRRVPVLLRAAAALAARRPELTVDVVGENRTHPRLDLPGLVGALGLEGRVRLSGFVDEADLALRYAAADAAVYLSEYEGFGLPVIEAMARGIPVVTAARPCLDEVYAGAAAFVDPADAPGVATALDRLLSDSRERERLIAAGRARAAAHSWARTAALTREALAEAAGA